MRFLSTRDQLLQQFALQQEQERRLTRAFLGVVRLAWDEYPLAAVERSVARGVPHRALDSIDRIMVKAGNRLYEFLVDAYHKAMIIERANARPYLARMGLIAKAAAPPSNLVVSYGGFGLSNPVSVQAHAKNRLELVRQMTDTQRDALRRLLETGSVKGMNPRQTAIRMRESLGLTSHQERIVANYRAELESPRPKFNPRKLRDRRFDRSVLRAIETGHPMEPEKIDQMVGRYRERWVKHRAETIARTESLRAVRGGQQGMWESLVQTGQIQPDAVRRFWVYTHDHRTRDWHRSTPGLNKEGRAINEPFRTGLGNMLMFPGDPAAPGKETINCRCVLITRPNTGNPQRDKRGIPDAMDIPAGKDLPAPMTGVPDKARKAISDVQNRHVSRKMPKGLQHGKRGKPELGLPRDRPRVSDNYLGEIVADVGLEGIFMTSEGLRLLNEARAGSIDLNHLAALQEAHGASILSGIPIDELTEGQYLPDGRVLR